MPNTTIFSSPTETQQQASLSGLRIALLISGGVDSAVATHLLCEQGLKPDLFYIKIGMEGEGMSCTAEEDIELSQATARRYGLHLEVVDLQKEYHDRVVAYVTDRVKRGLTPNPDVMCNRLIKFGAFEERIGFAYDRIATGHYAQILRQPDGSTWLAPSPDPVKDQSDFLAQLTSQQVGKLLLPIGHLHKEEVRHIAATHHLAPAKRRDSQGICFLGKSITAVFSANSSKSRKAMSLSLKRGARLALTTAIGFTPSASERASASVAVRGLLSRKTLRKTLFSCPTDMTRGNNTAANSSSPISTS